MKLTDFKTGSVKSSTNTIQKRLGRKSEIHFINALKEEDYKTQLASLTEKVRDFNSMKDELQTAKIQRQKAVREKGKLENLFNDLKSKFERTVNSLKQYEDREPQIKRVMEQHRDLNGQVAELQSKLQIVVEQHDEKIDIINGKIEEIFNLTESLRKSERAATKAMQAKLEATMYKEEAQKKLDDASTKNSELSIIYKKQFAELEKAKEDINVLNLNLSDSETDRKNLTNLYQKFQKLNTKIMDENRTIQAESKIVKKENAELNSDVVEMTSIIKELQKDIAFTVKENEEMFAELTKPRFASVASISKKEGFKFPILYEPRANTLGTGKPTLLRKKD